MPARRQQRQNPVIGGIDLPDDMWVALDRVESTGAADRAAMDRLWERISREGSRKFEIIRDWAHGHGVAAEYDTGRTPPREILDQQQAIDRLRDLAHEETDGLTAARLAAIAGVGHNAKDLVDLVDELRDPMGGPAGVHQLMQRANVLLRGLGVEDIREEGAWTSRFYADVIALYVNMGDTYATTLLFDAEAAGFMVTSWGDFVERREHERASMRFHHVGTGACDRCGETGDLFASRATHDALCAQCYEEEA